MLSFEDEGKINEVGHEETLVLGKMFKCCQYYPKKDKKYLFNQSKAESILFLRATNPVIHKEIQVSVLRQGLTL